RFVSRRCRGRQVCPEPLQGIQAPRGTSGGAPRERRLAGTGCGRNLEGPVDIAALAGEARRFGERVRLAKERLGDPGFEWYPYDTLSALGHLEKFLTGANRTLFDGRGRVLDMGSQDGELAFFLESLGYQVIAVDHPAYNHNGMRGIRALKAALGSAVEIHELDVDRPFTLPHDTYDLVFFL